MNQYKFNPMTQEEFNQKAKVVLRGQQPSKVEMFFKNFSFIEVALVGDLISIYRYRTKNEQIIKDSEQALIYLKRLARDHLYAFHLDGINAAINTITSTLEWNESHKPSGRKPKLTNGDCIKLRMLQDVFADCFPELSPNFTSENIINKLGELLLAKTLPNSTDKQINQFKDP